jgi:hypothetical protein
LAVDGNRSPQNIIGTEIVGLRWDKPSAYDKSNGRGFLFSQKFSILVKDEAISVCFIVWRWINLVGLFYALQLLFYFQALKDLPHPNLKIVRGEDRVLSSSWDLHNWMY